MAKSEEISMASEIDALTSKRPFQPFSIIMASGSRYEISVNDAVAVGRSTIAVYPHGGGQQLLHQRLISEVNIPGGAS